MIRLTYDRKENRWTYRFTFVVSLEVLRYRRDDAAAGADVVARKGACEDFCTGTGLRATAGAIPCAGVDKETSDVIGDGLLAVVKVDACVGAGDEAGEGTSGVVLDVSDNAGEGEGTDNVTNAGDEGWEDGGTDNLVQGEGAPVGSKVTEFVEMFSGVVADAVVTIVSLEIKWSKVCFKYVHYTVTHPSPNVMLWSTFCELVDVLDDFFVFFFGSFLEGSQFCTNSSVFVSIMSVDSIK